MSALPVATAEGGGFDPEKLRKPRKGDTVPLSPNLALSVEWNSRVPITGTITSKASGEARPVRLEPRATTPGGGVGPLRQDFSLWTELDESGLPVLAEVTWEADNEQPVEGLRVGLVVV